MKKRSNSTLGQFFKDHPLALHLLIMLAISLVVATLILYSLDLFTRHGSEQEMPDLHGMTLEEASQVGDFDFEFVITDSIFVDTLSGGSIAIQDPAQGSMVKKGRKVYVTLAKFVENDVRMPDVKNRPLKLALSALEGAGLSSGQLNFVYDYSDVHNLSSEVLRASFNGRTLLKGDKLPQGSRVDLDVSIDTTYVPKLPNLIGMRASEARKALNSRCLNVGEEHFEPGADKKKARVWKQDPEFSRVRTFQHGQAVDLWYKELSASESESLKNAAESNAQAEVSEQGQELDDVMSEMVRSSY